MSIFGSIVSAIFGKGATPGSAAVVASEAVAPAPKGSATVGGGVASGKPMALEEVDGMIKKIADGHKEKYNWNQSIVDLMKLLNLDSSLAARKQLAKELGYKGDLNGSAEMNTWLHKQVMTKLAESGGVVPDSLKHA